MKRKYIKPTTSVVRVETQNNYCHATSWAARDASGAVQSAADRGYVPPDVDVFVNPYNPCFSKNW